ncbi:hypothetical protein L2095_22495 [Bacillus zanthoxyli]|nr:hypothetical protein [Bacillus zanthoxyli]
MVEAELILVKKYASPIEFHELNNLPLITEKISSKLCK